MQPDTVETRARLPLTVIGGFLGAGKTTFLNRWLRQAGAANQRLAVLVNDFGALNIDARLIEAHAGDTYALTNGCVCCQIGDDLSMALIQVLDSGVPFDAVVIEASGVSDPWRVAQMGRADPGLSLDGVVVLVDAGAALQQSRDPLLADTLERQLRAADLVVLNKTDLASTSERSALHQWIGSVAGPVPTVETVQAEVPLALFSGLGMPVPSRAAALPAGAHLHAHDVTDHGTVFDAWSSKPTGVFSTASLRAWLTSPPLGLLRLKGVVRTGDADWSEIQFSGRHGAVRTTTRPAQGAAVVAIGLCGQLPTAALNAVFGR